MSNFQLTLQSSAGKHMTGKPAECEGQGWIINVTPGRKLLKFGSVVGEGGLKV